MTATEVFKERISMYVLYLRKRRGKKEENMMQEHEEASRKAEKSKPARLKRNQEAMVAPRPARN